MKAMIASFRAFSGRTHKATHKDHIRVRALPSQRRHDNNQEGSASKAVSTITIEPIEFSTLEHEAQQAGLTLPIEQTGIWAAFQADIPGRTPAGSYRIGRDGNTVAFMSMIDMETHGYHYLRSMHGPVRINKPNEAEEREVIDALAAYFKKHDKRVAFLRIDTWYDGGVVPVLSTVPYDQTVVIDVTGGDDAILSRMKRRGRRDVRKSLRECPAEVADETSQAIRDFSEYYDVMVETGKRDGFTPAPITDYSDMIQALGADHCRVFAGRIDNRVVAWSIVTVNGTHAVRYYAGMRSDVMRMHVTDKLLYSECCILGAQGITEYDLMGIGSDFAPSLKGLNEFKTKFTEEVTPVAAGHDVPIKTVLYKTLTTIKSLRGKLRELKNGKRNEPDAKKADAKKTDGGKKNNPAQSSAENASKADGASSASTAQA